MKRIITLLGSVLVVLLMSIATIAPVAAASPMTPVMADAKGAACAGIGLGGGTCNDGSAQTQATKIIGAFINVFSVIVGVAAVVMIIMAGMKFITSSGDPGKIANARTTLTYAIVGLVVVAFAQSLVYFVLARATSP
jgi:cytochrome bd-type quinol oxidase subunit 2